jgi:ATP-dependent Lhr-like helicase
VRAEAWPQPANADELHDALTVHGFLTERELARACAGWRELAASLQRQCRATRLVPAGGEALYVAAERLHEFLALFPRLDPAIRAVCASKPAPADAQREILRSRLELLGPVTAGELGAALGLAADAARAALFELEAEGAAMRGDFEQHGTEQWCDRRLLARIHRATRERLRQEIQPVPPAAFMRFVFRWHRLAGSDALDERGQGEAGLLAALSQLEGFAAPAAAWEEDLLPARVKHYLPDMLDRLCGAGRVAWLRPATGAPGGEPRRKTGPIRTTPIVLCERTALGHWHAACGAPEQAPALTPKAQLVFETLRVQGASFFSDLIHDTRLVRAELEDALGELVSEGLVHCDSFAGLRGLVMPAERRNRLRRRGGAGLDAAGRWSLARARRELEEPPGALAPAQVEHVAHVLLRRYGVVFRKLLEREDGLPPWRELFYVYRRLEARGEIRGGRFVSGFSGEQFALPEAIAPLRRAAKETAPQRVAVCAADPLNLVGVLTPGEKVPRLPGNRVLFENGVPAAAQIGGTVRYLKPLDAKAEWEFKTLLIRKQRPGGYLDAPPRPQ